LPRTLTTPNFNAVPRLRSGQQPERSSITLFVPMDLKGHGIPMLISCAWSKLESQNNALRLPVLELQAGWFSSTK
jgi:hypothetical protein